MACLRIDSDKLRQFLSSSQAEFADRDLAKYRFQARRVLWQHCCNSRKIGMLLSSFDPKKCLTLNSSRATFFIVTIGNEMPRWTLCQNDTLPGTLATANPLRILIKTSASV